MNYYEIKVYTKENSEYSYGMEASGVNVAREHAKRILLEGYWQKSGKKEVFHAPWRIVKVKIEEVY